MPTTKTAHKTFHTSVNLPAEKRQALIELLNQRLADTSDLYSQIKQAHWNVKGLNFFQLHELFDALAGEIFPFIDEIAERVTALGGSALGTNRQAAAASILPEYPASAVDGPAHLKALVERYAKYANAVRESIDESDSLGDKDTADLFTGVSRTADKNLWFLEAHLQSVQG
jgi:starvation-inducible DNA-binding protein